MKNMKLSQKAFTLLELLVVMAILALLVGLGLRTFGSVQQKSRDSKRKEDLQSISKTLELYYNDFKHYPYASGGKILGCGENSTEACEWGDVWQNTSNQTLYMSKMPRDPGGNQYFYLADAGGTSYRLFSYLENTEDESVVLNEDNEPAYYGGTYCRIIDTVLTASTCNYIIMSTNIIDAPTVVDSY
ncbi:type II secretion system GspH family protein [Patescibacteria group bacterium]|nr:type II secretion system GspH family protein [Patescibacteria group bacterium]